MHLLRIGRRSTRMGSTRVASRRLSRIKIGCSALTAHTCLDRTTLGAEPPGCRGCLRES